MGFEHQWKGFEVLIVRFRSVGLQVPGTENNDKNIKLLYLKSFFSKKTESLTY